MKRQAYQLPELRDANDNIIQEGTYGKESPLVNSDNTGVLDYINNNLMYLYNNTMGGTGGTINTETITGKTGTITSLTATTVKAGTVTADALNGPLTGNVTGDLNGNVTGDVTGNLTGNVKGNLTGNVAGTADKAVADGDGNDIVNTYVTKSSLASGVTTGTGKVTTLTAIDSTLTNLIVTGQTTVPTANAGNSSKAIANTAYVQGELTNYLPLSEGIERVSAKGTYGIRFESGIQICWGELSIPAGTSGREVSGTMTFPYPFANTNYVLTFGNDWLSSSSEYHRAEGRNTGSFKFTAVGVNTNSHKAFYMAIGYWK